MIYNIQVREDTTKRDKQLLCGVIDLMHSIDDEFHNSRGKKNYMFECHSICRAVAIHLPELKVIDGYYLGIELTEPTNEDSKPTCTIRGTVHSWLETPDEAIIDPYPVGMLAANPVLVVTKGTYKPFGGGLYQKDPKTNRHIATRATWRKSVVLANCFKTKPSILERLKKERT